MNQQNTKISSQHGPKSDPKSTPKMNQQLIKISSENGQQSDPKPTPNIDQQMIKISPQHGPNCYQKAGTRNRSTLVFIFQIIHSNTAEPVVLAMVLRLFAIVVCDGVCNGFAMVWKSQKHERFFVGSSFG